MLSCDHGAGTYAAMTEKLDYLTRLGVNALELQPVHEFNELEYYQVHNNPWQPLQVNLTCWHGTTHALLPRPDTMHSKHILPAVA